MKNIVLIGFMGTGKTSTGKLLAKRLGAAFIDLDRAIEEEYGMTIPAMFEQKGEAYFRACEHAMVEKTASRRNTVISTGGGTVKDPANMAALHAGGIIVCLKADIDTILARTVKTWHAPCTRSGGSGRPPSGHCIFAGTTAQALRSGGFLYRYEYAHAA